MSANYFKLPFLNGKYFNFLSHLFFLPINPWETPIKDALVRGELKSAPLLIFMCKNGFNKVSN